MSNPSSPVLAGAMPAEASRLVIGLPRVGKVGTCVLGILAHSMAHAPGEPDAIRIWRDRAVPPIAAARFPSAGYWAVVVAHAADLAVVTLLARSTPSLRLITAERWRTVAASRQHARAAIDEIRLAESRAAFPFLPPPAPSSSALVCFVASMPPAYVMDF
jgi:hypothetical protein